VTKRQKAARFSQQPSVFNYLKKEKPWKNRFAVLPWFLSPIPDSFTGLSPGQPAWQSRKTRKKSNKRKWNESFLFSLGKVRPIFNAKRNTMQDEFFPAESLDISERC